MKLLLFAICVLVVVRLVRRPENKDKRSIVDSLKGVIHDLMDKIDTAREEHSPTIPMAIVALVLVALSNRFFGKFAGFLFFAGIILMLPLLLRKSESTEE